MSSVLEQHFLPFRQQIIGQDLSHKIGEKDQAIIYADWTASGRLYHPIESYISNTLGPYIANTHTETNLTGSTMTLAYHQAQKEIKHHVNACDNDILITSGAGMTDVVNNPKSLVLPGSFSESLDKGFGSPKCFAV